MSFPGSNFAIASCEQPKDLPFTFGALVRFDAEHDGRRPPSLCDDEGLLCRANPLESRRRMLSQIGDRDDVRHLGHRRPSYIAAARTANGSGTTPRPASPLRPGAP